MIAKKDVLKYFREMAKYHIDPQTGEMSATLLAEDAASYFNAEEGADDYENIYDWAAEYAIEHNGH
jgi:hypothetical protein